MNSPISHKRKRAYEKGMRTISMRIRLLWGTTLSFFSSMSDVYVCVCSQTNATTFKHKPAENQTGSAAGKKRCLVCSSNMLSPVPLVRDLSMDPASSSRIEAMNESLGDIGHTILESLSQSLHLDPTKNFAAHHPKSQVSPTALGILRYLPYEVQIQGNTAGHVPHTDIGSLSKVFSNVPGLQV